MHVVQRARRVKNSPRRVSTSATDYVILGSGSAGSVLASRLSEDPNVTVRVIEAGPKNNPWTIRMPAACTYPISSPIYNWHYHTTKQKHLNSRVLSQPRGRVVGGSSAINAMVYARGHPEDFQRWTHAHGVPGWEYADVLPYFKKAQTHAATKTSNDTTYRGNSGPLHVRSFDASNTSNELFNVFVEAGIQAGYSKTDDNNGYRQEGFGPYDMTVSPNGVRCSTAMAYLFPALSRLAGLETDMLVTRIIFEKEKDGDEEGKYRAVGVEAADRLTGERKIFYAKKEVICCLGSIGSPQVLMLSGLGDAEHLRSVGVLSENEKPIVDNPWIGFNFQDHLEIYLQYLCKKPITLFPYVNWSLRYFHRRIAIGLEWFLRGTGICASNQFESGAFIRSRAGILHPDLQLHFIPGCVLEQMTMLPKHGFQVHVGTLRPRSIGSVRLASSDPFDAPLIDPNYLSNDNDMTDLVNGIRLADEVIQQEKFSPYRGDRIWPPPSVDFNDDNMLAEWVRENSQSAYHPSCSLAMGKVVDEFGRVMGCEGLRVVDASIFPSVTSGNTNAPVIMVAEKIADHIRGRKLPREEVDYFLHEDWLMKQR